MTEEKKVETQNEAENLLNEYNDQAENDGTHFYSEVWHSDYSDSSCCCQFRQVCSDILDRSNPA